MPLLLLIAVLFTLMSCNRNPEVAEAKPRDTIRVIASPSAQPDEGQSTAALMQKAWASTMPAFGKQAD